MKIVLTFVTIVVITAALAFWSDRRIDQASKRITATQAITQKLVISQSLQDERVCSTTNRGEACRDLFRRLAEDISPAQRRQLACTIASILKLPEYKEVCA